MNKQINTALLAVNLYRLLILMPLSLVLDLLIWFMDNLATIHNPCASMEPLPCVVTQ